MNPEELQAEVAALRGEVAELRRLLGIALDQPLATLDHLRPHLAELHLVDREGRSRLELRGTEGGRVLIRNEEGQVLLAIEAAR
jgi:hypothetical protein